MAKKDTLILFVITLISINNYAQNLNESKYYARDTVHWEIELPIWVPGFRGQFSYGDTELTPPNNEEKKEFERLNKNISIEFYFGGKISARFNKFLFQIDMFSGKIGSSFVFTPENIDNEKELVYAQIHATIPRLNVGYSVWETHKNDLKLELIPYVGLRYVNVHLLSDVFNNDAVINVQPQWFEPIAGIFIPFSYKRMKVELQADYGKNSSKNSITINTNIRYRISRLIDVKLGWMYLNLKHNDTFENENLDLNFYLSGPSAGVSFKF